MRTELVTGALSMAFTARRPPAGVIFHSDRGCPVHQPRLRALARENGVVLSVSRKGECWAVAESFFATIKRELLDRTLIWNQAHLQRILREYETHHNLHRPHRSLHGAAPLRPLPEPVDAMIAAVAASRGMAVATRNASDFAGMGVELLNPWDAHPG